MPVPNEAACASTAANADARAPNRPSARSPNPAAGLSPGLTLLFAVASGLAVANAYFAHPLLDMMADDIGLSRAHAGLIVAATQLGYGLGLILLVPIGDLVDRRRLVIAQSLLSVLALVAIAFATGPAMLLATMATMGLLAVVTQAFVAFAASLAPPDARGRIVGAVTSGIVIGILLARTIAGALTDLAGWRSVYLASALSTLLVVALLYKTLPRQPKPASSMPYARLIASLFALIATERVLLVRGLIAMLIFADITTLLTPLVLPLSAPPFSLSHGAIGLFGLAGVAGALAAGRAGRWADRGHAQRVTGAALLLMFAAWGPIAMLPHSMLWLVLGVVIVDFGLQAAHVTNQAMIYRTRPEAQSRLTAGYMLFYAIGSALGSSSSTIVYAHAGWGGICMLGAGIALATIFLWAATLQAMPASATRAL
ncbi:MFS transporter [Sphingomonas colocasiae]|uniref:MFS transporter n=1 Tax=Sphingomonas colocasiae TaxID=1848973 RepID=A0ABS7PV57_9SPHN|nr:MFS transporter [Sphingomonas colocasiae]MBY8825234.1 MFS transporter [Sphingomonas colocasiae]